VIDIVQKLTPFLWFDKNCEEAVNYYVDVFNGAPYGDKNSKINFIQRYEKGIETPGAREMEGKVLTTEFELAGQKFQALDGGPIFKFNESISLLVDCKDQKEVDYFWGKLSAVPKSEQCGWCKDKFGLSWQIIPRRLGELLGDHNREKSHKVANAMLKMHKIVVADLEKAAGGRGEMI
jgi:predicted 3-demethylubiquinone-9 3-methyltransferase (glyoxalase superfamily)